MFKKAIFSLLGFFSVSAYMGGVGRFDSVGGTYAEQTRVNDDKLLYYEMYTNSPIGELSKSSSEVPKQTAFGESSITPVIKRVKISTGDEMKYTYADAVEGVPTYGDKDPAAGGVVAFKNKVARVNLIKSPAFQVVGKVSQQRAASTISTPLPDLTKKMALLWAQRWLENELAGGILNGCSPSGLKTTSDGGLGVSQGIGSGVGAGIPLMCKNVWTHDGGFPTYTDYATHTLWNAKVNSDINNIDAAADDMFTIAFHEEIRAHLDDIQWESVLYQGKGYKALAYADPEVMWRLWKLLATQYTYATPRSDDNKVFRTSMNIELNEILYMPWPNLKKYRPAYNASNGYPDFGPLTTGTDPLRYSTSSKIAPVIYLGGGALSEGYNDVILTTWNTKPHNGPTDVVVHMWECFMRNEWYAQDGRTLTEASAVENRNSLIAFFYEPGVGKSS
ncbi:MAG: hypothetical protein PHN44_00145 [Candidatus Marinimicrobia bacterium]|nr:hypothetical protein [Candidatus Neomarinimicrobiota bacterium]